MLLLFWRSVSILKLAFPGFRVWDIPLEGIFFSYLVEKNVLIIKSAAKPNHTCRLLPKEIGCYYYSLPVEKLTHHVFENTQYILQLSSIYVTLIFLTRRFGKPKTTKKNLWNLKMNGWGTGYVWSVFNEVWTAVVIMFVWSKAISRVKVYLYFQGI